MATILVLHGPNLNLLGEREPGIYGSTTLADINQRLEQLARNAATTCCTCRATPNTNWLSGFRTRAREGVNFILINPAAFTHTSVALRDALARWTSRSSRSTCPMFTPGKSFARLLLFRPRPGRDLRPGGTGL